MTLLSLCTPLNFRTMRSPCCLCVCLPALNIFVFYAVLVISKESMRLVPPRTFCYTLLMSLELRVSFHICVTAGRIGMYPQI
jgi:hypothetical protein